MTVNAAIWKMFDDARKAADRIEKGKDTVHGFLCAAAHELKSEKAFSDSFKAWAEDRNVKPVPASLRAAKSKVLRALKLGVPTMDDKGNPVPAGDLAKECQKKEGKAPKGRDAAKAETPKELRKIEHKMGLLLTYLVGASPATVAECEKAITDLIKKVNPAA